MTSTDTLNRCNTCLANVAIGVTVCHFCGNDMTANKRMIRECPFCNKYTRIDAEACQRCGRTLQKDKDDD